MSETTVMNVPCGYCGSIHNYSEQMCRDMMKSGQFVHMKTEYPADMVPKSKYDSLLSAAREAEKALEEIQWSDIDDDGGSHCPVCGYPDYHGHSDTCKIGTALSHLREHTGA